MKKRILGYLKHVDEFLKNPPEDTDWDDIIKEHETQIRFFAHERLIHLIVTVLFALMATIIIVALVVSFTPSLAILLLPILILLFPYINHYYLLENSVQKMYDQYDKMRMFQRKVCLSDFHKDKK